MATEEHRYLLFGGSRYYPSGGWRDFRGSFPTLEAAREAGMKKRPYHGYVTFNEYEYDWVHVVDDEVGAVVWEASYNY